MFSGGASNSIVTQFGLLIHSFEAIEAGRSPARSRVITGWPVVCLCVSLFVASQAGRHLRRCLLQSPAQCNTEFKCDSSGFFPVGF